MKIFHFTSRRKCCGIKVGVYSELNFILHGYKINQLESLLRTFLFNLWKWSICLLMEKLLPIVMMACNVLGFLGLQKRKPRYLLMSSLYLQPTMSTKQTRLIANFFFLLISRKYQAILRNTRQGSLVFAS